MHNLMHTSDTICCLCCLLLAVPLVHQENSIVESAIIGWKSVIGRWARVQVQ